MKRLNSFDNAKAQFYTIAHFALLVIVMHFAFIRAYELLGIAANYVWRTSCSPN